MELRELGKTGTMVPEIGVGVWRYGGGVEPLRQAIELGAALIDTAEAYGSEKVVGEAVKGIRDQVFIATKVSGNHLHHDEVLKAAEASLRRLDTSYIDLYQIHWPNSLIPIEATMRAMETLVDRGLVKYIGVSNFSMEELRDAQAAMNKYSIVSNRFYTISIAGRLKKSCCRFVRPTRLRSSPTRRWIAGNWLKTRHFPRTRKASRCWNWWLVSATSPAGDR